MVTWLELAKQNPESREWIIEHIKDNIRCKKESLRFENETIGVMVKMREGTESSALKDYARYFITISLAEIEDLTKGIEDERREIAEIERLSGAGQGNQFAGNAPDFEQTEGWPLQHQVRNTWDR